MLKPSHGTQLLIPKACNLAKLDLKFMFLYTYPGSFESKSEARFELNVKQRVYLGVQMMCDHFFANTLFSGFYLMISIAF